MLKKEDIDRFYEDVKALGLKFPGAAIAEATGHSKSNVSKYLNRKLEPSEAFLNAFYEKFPKEGKKVSRETNGFAVETYPISNDALKDELIAALKRENSRLQKDLDFSLGALRHNALLARAVAETNQDLLIELLAKQRKQDFDSIAVEVGKENHEKYEKLKEEGILVGVDRRSNF